MALQASLPQSSRPYLPPFPLVPQRDTGIPACAADTLLAEPLTQTRALGTAASGGDDDFPYCPLCGGFHSESFDCRPPWLAEHLDSRDPGIPNC